MTAVDLASLAADVVALARQGGASDAEAVAREGDEFSVTVRMGDVETLKESGSRALGLRVFEGKRSASASTSDLTADGIRQLVAGALALVKVTEEDPFAGLPDGGFGAIEGDLHLYDEDVYSLEGAERIDWARRVEAAALAADPRVTNSDGGSFDAATGRMVLANSRGFAGGYRTSYASVSVAPLATESRSMIATRRPVRANSSAQAAPTMPAPATATSTVRLTGVSPCKRGPSDRAEAWIQRSRRQFR